MEVAKVDIRGGGVVPGGAGWEAARAAVTASMVAHGCVVVVVPDADLHRRALFSRALPELFALPLDVKRRIASTKGEFRGTAPGMDWESFAFFGPADAAVVHGFAETLWPEGNPEFCETVVSFAKNVQKLEHMVEAMVLEGLGVRAESIGAHFDLLKLGMRLSRYNVPSDTESSVSLAGHHDGSTVTAIVQHEVEGLEVRVGGGRWVAVPPEPGTVTFVAGDLFRVVTNDRVPACFHRVRTPSGRERFAVQLYNNQQDGVVVRVLEDLVDAEHPRVFNPLRHKEYFHWRYYEEGSKLADPLKAYCGVEKVGDVA